MVSLRHDDETISIYVHLRHDGVAVDLGDWVPRGALLGWSGTTGSPGGVPHLHFQLCLRSGTCSHQTQEFAMPASFNNALGTLTRKRGWPSTSDTPPGPAPPLPSAEGRYSLLLQGGTIRFILA